MALPPGPQLPPVLQTLFFLLQPTASRDRMMARYGGIYLQRHVFFGAEVTVSDPALIKQVFAGDPEVFHAGEANEILTPLIGERSLLRLDGEAHRCARRRITPPFHGEEMHAHGEPMREIAERVVTAWRVGEEISLHPSMQRITLEVMLRAVFGLVEGRHAELRLRLGELLTPLTSPFGLLLLMPPLERRLGRLPPWTALKRERERVDELLYAEIARRRAELAEPARARRTDVLSRLVEARDEHGLAIPDKELRDELITLLIAGHETTATALCWAFEQILARPEVSRRLLAEMDAAAPEGPLRVEQIDQLPYLDATIRETLRLRPIVPEVSRVLTRAIVMQGYEVPAGTILSPSIYNTQRRADLYPDPEAFRPERFLGTKPDPSAWFPFGGGARRCLGMAFALFEMKIVIAVVLRRFRLQLARPAPLKVVLRSFFFAPEGGTRVVIEGVRARSRPPPAPSPRPASPGR